MIPTVVSTKNIEKSVVLLANMMITTFKNFVSFSDRTIPFFNEIFPLLWIFRLHFVYLQIFEWVIEAHLINAYEFATSKIMDHSFTCAYSHMTD